MLIACWTPGETTFSLFGTPGDFQRASELRSGRMTMRKEYDFRTGRRGAITRPPPGKTHNQALQQPVKVSFEAHIRIRSAHNAASEIRLLLARPSNINSKTAQVFS